jgi:hypothetical protein
MNEIQYAQCMSKLLAVTLDKKNAAILLYFQGYHLTVSY